MRRISDFLILGIQIALGYILVHFASPWTGNISLRIASFAILIAGVVIGVKALIDLGNSFAVAPAPHEKSHFIAKGIYFETNSAVIKTESYEALDRVVFLLKKFPGAKVNIIGNTDNVGTPEFNFTLSQNRANAVKQYLLVMV